MGIMGCYGAISTVENIGGNVKSQIYNIHYPIYLTKAGTESEIVAILKVEYDTSTEDNFLLSCLNTINVGQKISDTYARTIRKIFAVRLQRYKLQNRMRTLLIRLICVGGISWKLIEWNQLSWRQHFETTSSMYINSSGDDITILLEYTLDNSDIDILTSFGSVPVVSINRLTIKEYIIWTWKIFTSIRS